MHHENISAFKTFSRITLQPFNYRQTAQEAEENQLGCAQVPAIGHDKSLAMSDAGVSPHSPQPRKRGRPRKAEAKKDYFKLRLSSKVKGLLHDKARATGFPAATTYVLSLIIDDLNLPPNEIAITRDWAIQKAHAENSVALNRVGNLLNQIAAAAHRLQPCPFSQRDLDELKAEFSAACRAHLSKVLLNDY